MKSDIKVPSMGESISEAVIGQILASQGTIVKADAEILELETDKVNQVLYAPQAGKLSLAVKPGETVKIGQVIGSIEEVSQSPTLPSSLLEKGQSKEEGKSIKSEKKSTESSSLNPSLNSQPESKSVKVSNEREQSSIRQTKEAFLTALKDAAINPSSGVDLSSQKVLASQPVEILKDQSARKETRRPLSRIRKVIATRLVEAQQTTAMLTTFNEVDLLQVIQLREKHQEKFTKKYEAKLGFMSFFIKATVSALQAFPTVNSYLDGEEVVHREYYDIGVAVGTDRGTFVPVIRHCDQLSFAQIEQAIDTVAKQAKEGKITLEDLQGGGFTITNGGVYGSLLSTPILIPPQCGILGMHKIEKRPVAIDDQIVIRPMMYLALSYDHRLIDGKESVSFLVHIKNQLEDPSRLLLDL